MAYVLVTDDPALEAAARLSAPDVEMQVFPLAGVTDARGLLGDVGRRIVEAAASADAVLVQYAFDRAPVLNTLGFHVRRRLGIPLIAVVVTGGSEDLVLALAAGADDAVGLPLHLPRIQARALAHTRIVDAARQQGAERPTTPVVPDIVETGTLRLDRNARRFTIRGEAVSLTPREFALLDYLLGHAGQVRSRSEILDAVWGLSFDTGTNMVDVYVYFLRRKLEAFGVRDLIETVRGRGYRLLTPGGARRSSPRPRRAENGSAPACLSRPGRRGPWATSHGRGGVLDGRGHRGVALHHDRVGGHGGRGRHRLDGGDHRGVVAGVDVRLLLGGAAGEADEREGGEKQEALHHGGTLGGGRASREAMGESGRTGRCPALHRPRSDVGTAPSIKT